MASEHSAMDKSTHGDSSGQMRGWFKLMETIRKTDPPSTSNDLQHSPDTDGHFPISLESIVIDHYASNSVNVLPISPSPSLPRQSIDDPSLLDVEPIPAPSPPAKRASKYRKRITIRKSTRSNTTNEISLPEQRRPSIDVSLPSATDVDTLPGHQRNQRFIHYDDFNTLSVHFSSCLFIEKKSSYSRQLIFKTRHNVLNKIFKSDYVKHSQNFMKVTGNLFGTPDEESQCMISSATSTSFPTDWSINRRSSSSHRHPRKNFFHTLLLNPKRTLDVSMEPTTPVADHSIDIERHRSVERIKDILIRTYCPHLSHALEFGHYFGGKPKLLQKDEPLVSEETEAPVATQSKRRGRKRKDHEDHPAIERRMSEEIPDTSIVVPSPISPDQNLSEHPKRKRNDQINKEKKKRRVLPVPSPDIVPVVSDSDDDDDDDSILPDQLPKQTLIKNGLRSNYYKVTSDAEMASISPKQRSTRKRLLSLPPFYTGLFESNDETNAYRDYQLPYDIYWFSQKQQPREPSPKRMKRRSNPVQEKPTILYEEIYENVYPNDAIRETLRASNPSTICSCRPTDVCADGICINRQIHIECSSNCPSGPSCNNQRIRQQQWFEHLEIFPRDKTRFSLRTKSFIAKGTFLFEYVGEIISKEKSTRPLFSMELNENYTIDASRMGNFSRYIRPSFSGNCSLEKWFVDGLPRMCLFSLRSIKAGEELTYHQEKVIPVIEELTEEEKKIVQHSSIFLERNRRRIKEKQRDHDQKKQQTIEEPSPLFFAQNYYHPELFDGEKMIEPNSPLTHRDLLNFFLTHIRRSHFAKIGRCSRELIDPTCYYAQLAQLNYILNELFESLLNYKCYPTEVCPSNALKKCPLKRLFPMYYEIIKKPIDLTIIRQKLDGAEYFTFQSFEDDLLLLFSNAVTYCGEESDVGRAVKVLEIYFQQQLKVDYQFILDQLKQLPEKRANDLSWRCFERFVQRFHAKEIFDGEIRQFLYQLISTLDVNSNQTVQSHRSMKSSFIKDILIHCRCGSFQDETTLIQCYSCQLWQHISCVSMMDSSQVYFCFECHPTCDENPSLCLKVNVSLPLQQSNFFLALTRSDGFLIRVNECYQIRRHDDLFFIERLCLDDEGFGQATGFYYRRPMEIFSDGNRKFYSNEVIRCPSNQEIIPISVIERPCYVLDLGTYCKGKPISEFTSRLTSTDLFLCEYRVDKSARTLIRIPKAKHGNLNTKSYCFDHYLDKLVIKREHQNEQNVSRRRSSIHWIKFHPKQVEEKSTHIDGLIEKIYCRFHPTVSIPRETKLSLEEYPMQKPVRNSSRQKQRYSNSRSDEHLIRLLLDQLISSISFQSF